MTCFTRGRTASGSPLRTAPTSGRSASGARVPGIRARSRTGPEGEDVPVPTRQEAGMRCRRGSVLAWVLVVALAGCSPAAPRGSIASASPGEAAEAFPTEVFAVLGDEPVSDALPAELQEA